MQVYIRFLRQGLVEAQTPKDFDTMTAEQKLDWASSYLDPLSDNKIVTAMADFDDTSVGFFDEAPYASAIEDAENNIGSPIVETVEWRLFGSGEGQKIAKEDAGANHTLLNLVLFPDKDSNPDDIPFGAENRIYLNGKYISRWRPANHDYTIT